MSETTKNVSALVDRVYSRVSRLPSRDSTLYKDLSHVYQVSHISHRYGSVMALDDVSFSIPQGSLMGFIGPDGVGKSTLLALISGAKKIQQGTIASPGRKDVAYMPQGLGSNLYGDLSILENIYYFATLFGMQKKEYVPRTQELLRRTGLENFADRRVRFLSGGMKQKLGLCCALIHEPVLLILDEPTTGVDPLSRREFWHLVADMRIRHPHMTILVASAYMEEAEAFDHLMMLHAGKVMAQGSPDTLKQQTKTASLEKAYACLLPKKDGEAPFEAVQPSPLQPNTPVVIEAQQLTQRFGHFTAVNQVTFAVKKGEIFGFLGPNGCGKTTTMKMLTGLLPPTSGKALLMGSEIDPSSFEQRKRFSYMSQCFSLYTELTVLENLHLHAHIFGMDKSEIRERTEMVLDLCDLKDIQRSDTDCLPLGQKQRLSLAVAIIHEPELLILDEPTSGVDPIARERFWHLIYTLSREHGMTIFVSTHYLTEAMYCDRTALMDAGQILACDKPQQLIQSCGAKNFEDTFIYYIEEERRRKSVATGV